MNESWTTWPDMLVCWVHTVDSQNIKLDAVNNCMLIISLLLNIVLLLLRLLSLCRKGLTVFENEEENEM